MSAIGYPFPPSPPDDMADQSVPLSPLGQARRFEEMLSRLDPLLALNYCVRRTALRTREPSAWIRYGEIRQRAVSPLNRSLP